MMQYIKLQIIKMWWDPDEGTLREKNMNSYNKISKEVIEIHPGLGHK